MMSRLGRSGLGLSLFVLSAAHAAAGPITWNFTGTFTDGGSASGSFIFDAGLDTYSSVNINTTTNGPISGANYLVTEPQFTNTSTSVVFAPAVVANYTNTHILVLTFPTALTNAGGTISINAPFSGEGNCSASNCNGNNSVLRLFSSGSVTSGAAVTATPEPSSIMMAGLGLAALAAWRNRAKRQA